jgi:hypothetical protein
MMIRGRAFDTAATAAKAAAERKSKHIPCAEALLQIHGCPDAPQPSVLHHRNATPQDIGLVHEMSGQKHHTVGLVFVQNLDIAE